MTCATDDDENRRQFESWWSETMNTTVMDLHRFCHGYACHETNRGWMSWNACRAAMLQASPICTCPSGDGSLRWPCPVHPGNPPAQSDCCPAQNSVNPAQGGNSPVIPEGYVMVPKEPTMEMLDEFDSIIDYGAEDSQDAWRRLLAAVPQEVKP